MIVYVCDRCGKTVTRGSKPITMVLSEVDQQSYTVEINGVDADLCPACIKAVVTTGTLAS